MPESSLSLAVVIAAAVLYVVATWMLWRRATGSDSSAAPGAVTIRALITLGLILHGAQLYRSCLMDGGINLALGNLLSLVCAMSVLLLLLASLFKRTMNLGLVVLPFGFLGLLVGAVLPGPDLRLEDLPPGIGRHILVAVTAYGVLAIAFAQALVLWVQERQLHKARPGQFFPALPAIETMESNLFQLIWLGFALLTVNLLTGMITTQQVHGWPLQFNHHNLLAILAWGGFGGLLLGRRIYGWRGEIAARWTVTAFVFLGLAYFGTRLVSDVILPNLH